MEALKHKWRSLPLRRFFILTVLFTIAIVVLLSALIIGGCAAFRHWLLPDSNAVYLTIETTLPDGSVVLGTNRLEYGQDLSVLPNLISSENGTPVVEEEARQTRYSIQKVENSFGMLTPKRKLAYQACGVLMAAAPAVLAFAGTFWCSLYFYRRKLKQPLELLSNAADQIARQDLDFVVSYGCEDEMGALCRSFEEMRRALYNNNRAMWEMHEERRLLQASVAHDLRNPIAIIEGYTEYLETGLVNRTISAEKAAHVVQNLNLAAKRLEQYTESVRLLNQSEIMELKKEHMFVSELTAQVEEDMRLLAQQKHIALDLSRKFSDREILVDSVLLHRILENIMSNALRFAKERIRLEIALSNRLLSVTVIDDGGGFSFEMQERSDNRLFSASEDGHMGIGLAVSRLLCKKHGGRLELSNTADGACVKIILSV